MSPGIHPSISAGTAEPRQELLGQSLRISANLIPLCNGANSTCPRPHLLFAEKAADMIRGLVSPKDPAMAAPDGAGSAPAGLPLAVSARQSER